MENLYISCFAPLLQKRQQLCNSNRFNLSSVLQLRTLACLCGPLQCVCGHDVFVHELCVLRERVCGCAGRSMCVGTRTTYAYSFRTVVVYWNGHLRLSIFFIFKCMPQRCLRFRPLICQKQTRPVIARLQGLLGYIRSSTSTSISKICSSSSTNS